MNKHKIVLTGMMVLLLVILALSTSQINAESTRASQIYVVTNTNSSGAGSLRQAILDANENPAKDYIYFDIPTTDPGYSSGIGVWFIRLTTVLPMLEDPLGVEIYGATQDDSNPDLPGVIIEGTDSLTLGSNLLIIDRHHNKIVDLGFFSSRGDSILVRGESNIIEGNQIFTSPGYGIHIVPNANYNTIRNNKICGHTLDGIYIDSAYYNVIEQNLVGIKPIYIPTVPRNGGNGITQVGGANNLIQFNTISDNVGHGIAIKGYSIIDSNTIGLIEDLGTALGNSKHGIYVTGRSNTITNNWISANGWDGIRLEGAEAQYNTIQKNKIGVSFSGEAPNTQHGIGLYNGAHDNEIGSETEPDKYNYITSNGWSGVVVVNSLIGKNSIANNFILYNRYYGVHINNSPDNDLLANVIVGNGDAGTYAGVRVENSSGLEGASNRNTIMDNRIGNNTGLGIDLVLDANHDIQNPTIFSASCTNVLGTTTAACGTSCQVQIFSDGEDEGYILEGTVNTVAAGNFSWSGFLQGPNVTATVTDADGNTSEFSLPKVNACIRKLQYLPLIMK